MKTEHIRIAVQYLKQQEAPFARDLGREVEKERQALWDIADAEWNAAIEAAALVLHDCGLDGNAESRADVATRIRALKREAK